MAAAAGPVLPEQVSEILEDGDIESLLPDSGEAEENEEFVDLSAPQPGESQIEPAAPVKGAKKKKEVTPSTEGEEEDELLRKPQAELVRMYRESQSLIGRQGSELGDLRKRADTAIQTSLAALAATRQPRQEAPTAPAAPAAPAEIDEAEFFRQPKDAVLRMIADHPAIKAIQASLGQAAADRETERAASSTARFNSTHPDAATIMVDPEFRQWVQASPIRQQLLARAHHKFDFDAGDEVFGTWKALRGIRAPSAQPAAAPAAAPAAQNDEATTRAAAQTLARRRQALRDAATPTSGNAAPRDNGTKKIYRRADVLELMENHPERYEALSQEIQLAYEEGRVR